MELHGTYLCTTCGFHSDSRVERDEHDKKDICNTFKCEQCDYESVTKSNRHRRRNLSSHMKYVHENVNSRGNRNNKLAKISFSCDKCTFVSTSKEIRDRRRNLTLHIQAVHDKTRIHCEQCNFSASQTSSFSRHMMRKHSEDNKHKCTHCEYWGIMQDVRLHVKLKHDPHKCEQCPYVASGRTYLGYHMKNQHEDLKRFECREKAGSTKCTYGTQYKHHLSQHVRSVHKKIKEYVCDACGYVTSYSFHLKKHQKIHQ